MHGCIHTSWMRHVKSALPTKAHPGHCGRSGLQEASGCWYHYIDTRQGAHRYSCVGFLALSSVQPLLRCLHVSRFFLHIQHGLLTASVVPVVSDSR